jgi:hypothetical protein
VGRYAMPPVYRPEEAGGGVRGLSPVRSRRQALGKCARNWSSGGYMRLKGRINAAYNGGYRRSPERGYGGFGGGLFRGWLWGSRGRQGLEVV